MQILWDGRGFLSDKSINRGIVFTCKTKLASAWTRSTTGASPCTYGHDLRSSSLACASRWAWFSDACTINWGERERAPSLVHSQAGGVTICFVVRSSSPRINCSTLYATPVGPREIPERIRRKLYVYFKNTTSTFRISGIYR